MKQVFLSYCHEDVERVEPFREALERHGVPFWLDVLAMRPGDNLPASIESGLRESECAIIFLSETYLAKAWTKAEMRYFTSRTIRDGALRLVIVHLDECEVPPLLEPILRNRPDDAETVAGFFAEILVPHADRAAPAETREIPVASFLAAQPDLGILGIMHLIVVNGANDRFCQDPVPLGFRSKAHGPVLIELIKPVVTIAIDELSAAQGRLKNYQRHCVSLDDQISRGGLGIFGAAFEIELERKTVAYQSTVIDIRYRLDHLIGRIIP